MNVHDIIEAISNLSKRRPVFYSEADFQFALAWELQKILPCGANIYLERLWQHGRLKYYVDIWVEENGKKYPIELKYKTKAAQIQCPKIGTVISLNNHSANDFGCYDYLHDIKRIEDIKLHESSAFGKGYAVFLTNDSNYYNNSGRKSAYSNFKIYQGAVRTGELKWGLTQNGKPFVCGTRGNFSLSGNYTMDWSDYNKEVVPEFKYLINEIG